MKPSFDATPPRDTLVGSVERVTFHNEDSGFSVLKVKARGQRDLVPVVGHAASISAGVFFVVWIIDQVIVGQRKALAIAVRSPGSKWRWTKLWEWLAGQGAAIRN